MADPISTAIGAGTDAFNALSGFGFGIFDRIRQNALDKYNIITDKRDFDYTKAMNEQAQKNFEAQMGFQQQQADLTQSNWEQQFNLQKQIQEANRIGNLTKEYKEAGLNPFLATGMGASTAQAVGGGASTPGASAPNFRNSTSKTLNAQNGIIPQVKMENYMAMKQLKMQEEMNEANITKLNAEANLANAEAEWTSEYKGQITEAQLNEIKQMIQKTIQDMAESKAREKHVNAQTEAIKLENEIISLNAIKAHAEQDIWQTMLDNLTPKQQKKLSKEAYKSLKAQVSQMATDEKYKKSQTFATYNEAICKDAQTLINAYSAITTGTQGAQQIQLNEQSIQNQMRRTETVNFYYDQNGNRHYTSGYERR